MAYCGTGNNMAIHRLLCFILLLVMWFDDVRRATVTSLGFLLFRLVWIRAWEKGGSCLEGACMRTHIYFVCIYKITTFSYAAKFISTTM